MYACIEAISYYLPNERLTNDELSKLFPEWGVEKIAEKTGIYNRHIVSDDLYVSDLAVLSAQKLFEENKINPFDIDFILLCTQSPDYFLPTTACLVQDRLGIPTSAGALDFNLGCSGYIYGLSLAKGLIETNQSKNVLLITAETYSKYLHPKDKTVRTLFGDAASATLLTSTKESVGIGNVVYGTDGRGKENLIVKSGAHRNKSIDTIDYVDEQGLLRNDKNLYMNGPEIFNFTLKEIPNLVNKVLEKSNFSADNIDLFVFHQANKFMLDSIRKKLKIPEEKFFTFMEDCGNTVSSTIPIALKEALANGKIKEGDKVLLAGFGVGYSWAGTIIYF